MVQLQRNQKQEEKFKKPRKLSGLRSSINHAERSLTATLPNTMEGWIGAQAIMKEIRDPLPRKHLFERYKWLPEIEIKGYRISKDSSFVDRRIAEL